MTRPLLSHTQPLRPCLAFEAEYRETLHLVKMSNTLMPPKVSTAKAMSFKRCAFGMLSSQSSLAMTPLPMIMTSPQNTVFPKTTAGTAGLCRNPMQWGRMSLKKANAGRRSWNSATSMLVATAASCNNT